MKLLNRPQVTDYLQPYVFRHGDGYPQGMQIRVMNAMGFIVGQVEAIYPFQGLCETHLFAMDYSVDDGATPIVLPDIVIRHYAECQVFCDDQYWVDFYREYFKDAIRVFVELNSERAERFRQHLERTRSQPQLSGPLPLQISSEEISKIQNANAALQKSLSLRMNKQHAIL